MDDGENHNSTPQRYKNIDHVMIALIYLAIAFKFDKIVGVMLTDDSLFLFNFYSAAVFTRVCKFFNGLLDDYISSDRAG